MEWINRDSELPPKLKLVLVAVKCTHGTPVGNAEFYVYGFAIMKLDECFYLYIDSDKEKKEDYNMNVTHWAMLPELPEIQKE